MEVASFQASASDLASNGGHGMNFHVNYYLVLLLIILLADKMRRRGRPEKPYDELTDRGKPA